MKVLRAILLAILLWVLIFVEISIFIIGLEITGVTQYIVHYVFLVIFAVFVAWLYYKSKDRINGFVLGIFMLLVANVLDLIITVPLFTTQEYATLGAAYTGFYSDLYLWVGFLIVVVVAGIYDIARKK